MKPASHNAKDDWQRLRRDKRSAVVVLAVIISGVASLLALLGLLLHTARDTDRSSPAYWALLIPFAWWAASLANYTPWAVRRIRFSAATSVMVALLSLAFAVRHEAGLGIWIASTFVAVAGAAVGVLLFPSSLLSKKLA